MKDDPDMYFRIYRDRALEWRWRLHASNHLTVADSGEGYNHKVDCLAAIKLVKGSGSAPIYE